MLFNSIQYIIFLPIMVIVYYIIPTSRLKNIWLLLGSYFFYMNWNAAYALLLLTATLVTYGGGLIIATLKEKNLKKYCKPCLITCLVINLSILCVFKYLEMAVGYINVILSFFNLPELSVTWNLLLPVGISFFTLQSVGYLIDVYRGDIPVEKNIITYALFVSFFPQLVAGPIERSKNLLSQLKNHKKFSYVFFQKGLLWILYGLMIKMVIADNLSIWVDIVFKDPVKYSGWYIVYATFAFTLQIYCDFYGYSIIAKGSAYLFGFELMSNFESPYYSKSIKEFWRRWHISLSTWFRDYLYIPLGGNRRGTARKNVNLLIVFLVSGLWHGASIAFVLWGFLNGIYQVIGDFKNKILSGISSKSDLFYIRFIKTVSTFVLVALTWIPFRAGSWSDTKTIVFYMITNLRHFGINEIRNLYLLWDKLPAKMGLGAFLGIGILAIVDYQKYHKKSVIDKVVSQKLWVRYAVYFFLIHFFYIRFDTYYH